jgi:hypothetical protein
LQQFLAAVGAEPEPDGFRKYRGRKHLGNIRHRIEFAFLDERRDEGVGLLENRLAQFSDRRPRHDALDYRAGARMQRRIGLQQQARHPPRLLDIVVETGAAGADEGVVVFQNLLDVGMPRYGPYPGLLQEHHGAKLAQPCHMRMGIDRKIGTKDVEVADRRSRRYLRN